MDPTAEEKAQLIDDKHVRSSKELPMRHPDRGCIMFSFTSVLVFFTFTFFIVGFDMNRPLLGPLFLAAVVPSLFILYLAYHRGTTNKFARGACAGATEMHDDKIPPEVLVWAFGLGILITIPVGLFGGLIQAATYQTVKGVELSFPALFVYTFLEAFLFTAVVEEASKYFCAHYSVNKESMRPYIVHPYGIVVFGLACALGFAALENVTYVLGERTDRASWMLAVVRALLSVPLHGTTGALIGVGLARREFLSERSQTFSHIMILPVIIHGTYDFVWMMPLRDGPLHQPKKPGSPSLVNEQNTRDIGGWLQLFHAANLLLVFFGARYAIHEAKRLRGDVEEVQNQPQV